MRPPQRCQRRLELHTRTRCMSLSLEPSALQCGETSVHGGVDSVATCLQALGLAPRLGGFQHALLFPHSRSSAHRPLWQFEIPPLEIHFLA